MLEIRHAERIPPRFRDLSPNLFSSRTPSVRNLHGNTSPDPLQAYINHPLHHRAICPLSGFRLPDACFKNTFTSAVSQDTFPLSKIYVPHKAAARALQTPHIIIEVARERPSECFSARSVAETRRPPDTQSRNNRPNLHTRFPDRDLLPTTSNKKKDDLPK